MTAHGATRLGIHHLRAGIVTRGVLLDVPALRGVDALEPGEPVFPEDLEAAEERAGLRVRAGDALLVRTGRWRWRDEHGPWDVASLAAGLDASCLPWLRDARRGHARQRRRSPTSCPPGSTASPCPSTRWPSSPWGSTCMDNLDLDALAGACAEERRWTFLLTVAPLVLRRGTASPVNPIAVF